MLNWYRISSPKNVRLISINLQKTSTTLEDHPYDIFTENFKPRQTFLNRYQLWKREKRKYILLTRTFCVHQQRRISKPKRKYFHGKKLNNHKELARKQNETNLRPLSMVSLRDPPPITRRARKPYELFSNPMNYINQDLFSILYNISRS